MNQYDFDKLIEKYLAGETSPDEEKLMREWSDRMIEQSQLTLSATEKQTLHTRIWKRIYTNTIGQQPFLVRYGWFRISAVAASILLFILAGFFVSRQATIHQASRSIARKAAESTGNITIKNTSNKAEKISLKDGSYVLLSPRSNLSYPEQFGTKTREIYLQGEATFDVTRDTSRPFIVHTGNLVTQVLGTRFTVKSYDTDKSIEVRVSKGKVSVYEAAEKSDGNRNGVILIPNQKITFDKLSQKLTPGLIETPQMVLPPENKTSFVFDRVPLGQVLATLSKAYGIEFIVENQALNKCAFNGDLNDLPLYLQLDLVCKSLNATYERRGTTLFINGEGCQN
ncbi:FecR family protein [Spirosoma panaciterrae]|uniref:FecR family protein n=1 Tax=Spirosoma panaciterrae TaxID=496058 RepID=UPI000375021E|nr:FecR family protein [Spirosoma panaciterrae]